MNAYSSVYIYIHMCVCIYIYTYVYIYIYIFICLSVCLPVCLSACLHACHSPICGNILLGPWGCRLHPGDAPRSAGSPRGRSDGCPGQVQIKALYMRGGCRYVASHKTPKPLPEGTMGLLERLREGYGSYPPLSYPPVYGFYQAGSTGRLMGLGSS